MKKFQTLYKKNTQGKIEQWNIGVFVPLNRCAQYKVKVTFGEMGGKQQTKEFLVYSGKNIGKKNETTVAEQALAEAEAKWVKKKKSGYVTDLKAAKAGKVDAVIEGGILPMLAHDFEKYQDKINFPVYVQPKLDGQRCIAIYEKGIVTLWTRSRKRINSCPHIVEQLQLVMKRFGPMTVALDGELYHHDLNDQFEKIMSAVRKDKPSKESAQIQYHVYDFAEHPNGAISFAGRWAMIESLTDYQEHIKFVQTVLVYSKVELAKAHTHYTSEGYEGTMVRDAKSLYENKRSKNLLKYKTFKDAEFTIIKFEPGKDNTVVAVLTNGKTTFKATMSGDKKKNQKYLKGNYTGKLLTVQFFSLTGKNKVPRFPVGLRVRDEL